jgi:cellulose synthase/poly-beta-1,6-N-acetylglucosamine synthase-like glycosyltransferase
VLLGLLVFLSVLFFLLSLHPFVTYPLSLLALRRSGAGAVARQAGQGTDLTFAICVCAYNEEHTIAAKAENMIAVAKSVPHCELFVYVDGSSDRTVDKLAQYGDAINVVVGEIRRGKSHGMNVLVDRCKADVIVFTDANVHLDAGVLLHLAPWFADPSIGCVCGHLIYSNPDDSPMANSGSLYWRIEEQIKQLESDTYNVIGADGSLFAIRRSAHHLVPDDIIDDFYLSMKILISGLRVVREPKALAFEKSATSTYDEFRRKIRIACQAFNVHRLIWREIRQNPMLAYCYVSHRLLKWTIGYNLVAAGVFLLAALFIAFPPVNVVAAVFAILLGFCALLALRNGLALRIFAMLLSFAGAAWGVWRSIRGDRFQTWTPTPSARATGSD